MYDHIRLLMPYPFKSEHEKETFCVRFGVFVKDEKKGIIHNKGYETLEQNKGIYIRIELPTEKRKGNITLSFSLHKFYNAMCKRGAYNYDDFDFKKANEAYTHFTGLMNLDFSTAIVKKYEIGINVITSGDPDEYMKELNRIKAKKGDMRIIEDLHFREYKQYSTNKNKDKRIVYIFYNKTFEVRSKIKDAEKRASIPENVLRIEKDYHRPMTKVYFDQLFDPIFQKAEKQDFYQRFVIDMVYKEIPVKTPGITGKQLSVWNDIQDRGEAGASKGYEVQFKQGAITRKQYRYLLQIVQEIAEKGIEPPVTVSSKADELKILITSKINSM